MCLIALLTMYLSSEVAHTEVGDRVVTLTTAPVMSGKKQLAEIEPGVELTAQNLEPPWVLVTITHGGKTTNGWILERHLVAKPSMAFRGLFGLIENKLSRPGPGRTFDVMDTDEDGALDVEEFVSGSKLQTLDDLNLQLRHRLNDLRTTITLEDRNLRAQTILMVLAGELSGVKGLKKETSFNGWKAIPTHDQALRMAKDFLNTQDIRRSSLAQQLVRREDADYRGKVVRALFRWADHDDNDSVNSEEFAQAVHSDRSDSSGLGANPVAMEADVRSLIRSLRDEKSSVRIRAAKSLEQMGQDAKEAVAALGSALEDDNKTVRVFASKALAKIGPDAKAAVPALANALGDENLTVRVNVARCLRSIGPDAKAAEPALLEALHDESSSVRKYAADTLDKIRSRP